MFETDSKSPYVDYAFYKDIYNGKDIKEEEFEQLEAEAEAYVTMLTFRRVARLETVPECVKKAVCSAAEGLLKNHALDAGEIQSENIDGYSATYKSALTQSNLADELLNRIKIYLSGTGLLYKGWSKKYDYEYQFDDI